MGSSIVYWAARRTGGRSGGPKLGLQIKCYTLHWLGKRGMQWKELIPTFDEYLLTRPRPQILLIQLGSNDLAILKSKELIELIRLDVLRLQALFPELILIWSEILPRCYWHFADNQVLLENTRKRTNTAVKGIFKSAIGKGFIIRNPNILSKEISLYRYDGVHLSNVGNDVYLNNIKGPLEAFDLSDTRIFPPE